jgi:hypothetical protein
MDGKIKQCVCINFFMKLGKFATETLEMFCEAFGEQRFLNGIHASRLVECQLKMTNVQGDQAPAKDRKC